MKTYSILSLIVLAILALVLAACAAPPATAVPTRAPASQPSVTPTSQSNDVTIVSDDQNGQTITVKQGTRIQLVLHSTYWRVKGSSDAQVLVQVGDANIIPDLSNKIPGIGAGTVTVEFQARQAGRADITASRTVCGEALACTPDQTSFNVTISVTS